MESILNHLRSLEPFNTISDDNYKLLKDRCLVQTYEENVLIFSQKDKPTGYLYFINDGLVEIISETDEGVEITVDYRKNGDFFGWTPIFTDGGYSAGARATQKTECLLIPKDTILQLARTYPEIARFFSKSVFSKIRKLYQDVVKSQSSDPILHIEAYPFQKQVREIMSSPAETCLENISVGEVAKILTVKGIDSILVCDDNNNLKGIITERDLVTKVLARDVGERFRDIKAKEIMTPNPFFINPDKYMYEAASFMLSHNIRHLPVLEGNNIVGIVTIRELMRFRSQKTALIVGKVKEAQTIDELKAIKQEITNVARVLFRENKSNLDTMEIISYIHHNIIRRCFELVLNEELSAGCKLPDIKYSFIIMGSGGRREMLLMPDQDNGIIFEDYPDELEAEVSNFFIPFTEKLVKALDTVGYPLCKGEVMVNNPIWRGKLSEWKKRVSRWITVPEPQRVRFSTIFFDLYSLIGDSKLCNDLKNHIFKEIKNNLIFLYQMMELDYKHKVPLGFLNRFITSSEEEHKGELSVKENGSIFIVDCIRMYSLENGIPYQNTMERLNKLQEMNIFNSTTADHIRAAFEFFTYIRLKNELNLIEQNKKPSHYLDPYTLPKDEQEALKEAFKVADKLQDSTRRHFARIVGL